MYYYLKKCIKLIIKKSIQPIESMYIRNLEAVFESIPQSVLQLTFIMRIESEDSTNSMGFIFLISTIHGNKRSKLWYKIGGFEIKN